MIGADLPLIFVVEQSLKGGLQDEKYFEEIYPQGKVTYSEISE